MQVVLFKQELCQTPLSLHVDVCTPVDSFALQGLGDMKVHKSRLEREREAAAAAATASKTDSPKGLTHRASVSASRADAVSASWGGQGLADSMQKHKSRLQRDKENATAAPASRVAPSAKRTLSSR